MRKRVKILTRIGVTVALVLGLLVGGGSTAHASDTCTGWAPAPYSYSFQMCVTFGSNEFGPWVVGYVHTSHGSTDVRGFAQLGWVPYTNSPISDATWFDDTATAAPGYHVWPNQGQVIFSRPYYYLNKCCVWVRTWITESGHGYWGPAGGPFTFTP
jgi:hypothetical protein